MIGQNGSKKGRRVLFSHQSPISPKYSKPMWGEGNESERGGGRERKTEGGRERGWLRWIISRQESKNARKCGKP